MRLQWIASQFWSKGLWPLTVASVAFLTFVIVSLNQPSAERTTEKSESDGVIAKQFRHTSFETNSNQSGETVDDLETVIRDNLVVPVQYRVPDEMNPTRVLNAVDQGSGFGPEPRWQDARPLPWEVLGAGEFLGPIRRPLEQNYRVRINDLLELTYAVSRKMLSTPYRIQLGDEIEINDTNRLEISKQKLIVLDDGFISPLEIAQVHVAGKTIEQVNRILNEAYQKAGTRDPSITIAITQNNTALTDLLNSIQGQFNANGSIKTVKVSPDGTIQLPIVGRICVYGLTLDEVAREVNLRYSQHIYNLNVTPALVEVSQKSVFVFGQVGQPGVIQLNGPTTALGAISAAQGFLQGANRRQVVVLRRDSQWRMIATRLDLSGAELGKSPIPSDDVWLRPSDIVIVPRSPIQRLAEFIDLYFSRTLFVLIPNQGISFSFDGAN